MKKKTLSLRHRRALYGLIFVSPWLIGILLFFFNPIIRTIQFSFSEIIIDSENNTYSTLFIGLQNFYEAFRIDIEFPKRLLASLIQMVTEVPVILIFSFFVAVLLKDKFRGASAVKTIFFLTVVLSSGVFPTMRRSIPTPKSKPSSTR